ncbi:LysR substrate-binding domain-containing protein [Roseobacter sp. A03A-229]
MTGSALSQSVRALEEELQVRLFNRTTRSVALTEAGELLVRRLSPSLNEIRSSLEEVRSIGSEPVGRIRLNAPSPALEAVILPYVARFLETYPRIALEITEDDRQVDIVADRYDFGIRAGVKLAHDMISVPLGGDQSFPVVASPAFLSRAGVPEDPEELPRFECIRHRFPNGTIFSWRFEKNGVQVAARKARMPLLMRSCMLRWASVSP